MTMYSAMTTDAIETLERIGRITADNPHDPRVAAVIASLRTTVASVMSASQGADDTRNRSSAHTVADGLSAAAEMCLRLQDRRS
ncbi:hypothetical protein NDK50_26570 [Paraburkholderia bryophila]|uniref:hypothetical protein n=1 Tax=Paraburkholderia bryophila TaxID=420952 RepID=UPI00234BA81A|nr:hypothetical protein [Paraburkholderia bryophila]WCM24380.1 hypothetical protein NDK50_26570 [Paraburkholderia bryophila]